MCEMPDMLLTLSQCLPALLVHMQVVEDIYPAMKPCTFLWSSALFEQEYAYDLLSRQAGMAVVQAQCCTCGAARRA